MSEATDKETEMAERVGFEPTVPFWGTRHFQCRQFSHSCTFPQKINLSTDVEQRTLVDQLIIAVYYFVRRPLDHPSGRGP